MTKTKAVILSIIATLMSAFIIYTVWMPRPPLKCNFDYHFNVSSEGEGFIFFEGERRIGSLDYGEVGKLDSLISEDNLKGYPKLPPPKALE